MKNVMLDLETLGLKPSCVVRSIGARAFNPLTGELGPAFYANVTLESCLERGLKVEEETLAWWLKQDHAAQHALHHRQLPLMVVAGGLECWWHQHGFEKVWANGAAFDIPVWEAATGKPGPWQYYNVMDTRTVHNTLYELTGAKALKPETGVLHNALDDCDRQIAHMAAAMKEFSWRMGSLEQDDGAV